MELKELNKQIIEWGREKGILSNSNPLAQISKTHEEATELLQAIVNSDEAGIKDAIGDIYVTLVLYAALIGHDEIEASSEYRLDKAYRDIGGIFVTISSLVTITLTEDVVKHGPQVIRIINMALATLNIAARTYNLEVADCVQSVLDIITKRSGKMINGVFVKDN